MTESIGQLVADHSLVVVTGNGGVGKTTVSAGLAIETAYRVDASVLVLTVDPARRLATALGVDIETNESHRVDLSEIGTGSPAGTLHAAMLDPGSAWDDLVRRSAPSGSKSEEILANNVYRRIADTFVHGNDYAALGWLGEAIDSDRFDLIIVDTAPSQSSLGLFDASDRVAEFFSSSLLGWLTKGESGRVIGGPAAKTFGSLADRLLGGEFFADIVEFFQLMQSVVPGMVERTARVAAELIGDDATSVVVMSPSPQSLVGSRSLVSALSDRGIEVGGVVVNGVEPTLFGNAKVVDVAERVAGDERSPFSKSATTLLRPAAEYVLQQSEMAGRQAAAMRDLQADLVMALPRTVHSPSSVAELAELAHGLWLNESTEP